MNSPRILIVTEAGNLDPSGMVRAMIYKPALQARQIEATYVTRLPLRLRKLLVQPPAWMRLAGSLGAGLVLFPAQTYLTRRNVRHICKIARDYDIIYLVRIASWPLVTQLREIPDKRLVFDLNDALWLPKWRHVLQGQLNETLKMVDAVTCDNPYGTAYAQRLNAESFVVPDPPQVELFNAARQQAESSLSPPQTSPRSPIVLGWIGSTNTCFHLYAIWEALEQLFAQRDDITLRLVGAGEDSPVLPNFEKVRVTCRPSYDQQVMIQEVTRMDIGLFPLFDVQEARGRGVLKAAVYMSGKAAVISSPVGQCNELITDGHNGLLAVTTEQWVDKLNMLIDDVALRQRLADNALVQMNQEFTIEKCLDTLLDVLIRGKGRRGEPCFYPTTAPGLTPASSPAV